MKLSVIIVNYNVRHFLEQCLLSVYRASKNIETEIFVVDNNSSDGSVEMLEEKFPAVKLIANKENTGFSKANNQAIKKASGEYILLLNPDTVVEENTFGSTLAFMDGHPEAGALGIKMIDGKGQYLPESKRGLPTPWVAFYKIFGLSGIFPGSKKFARYYMGHLSENQNHEIEVLAGAFMLMKKDVLDKVGYLDESFFMYGEDIDLSYRFNKAGYKNYYFSESQIIHYKGESTKKGSLNYVYVFYKAMIIFAEKHFSNAYAGFFRYLILIAIYLRAGLSLLKRIVNALALPLFDFIILIGGLYFIKEYWENNHRFIVGGEYSWELISIAFPLYALGWIGGIFLNGGYEKPARIPQLIKGIFWGSIAIIVVYSLLSEEYRFSRAILLMGAVWATIAIPLSRLFFNKIFGKNIVTSKENDRRILLVGNLPEVKRVEGIIKNAGSEVSFIAYVSPESAEADFIGNIVELPELCRELSIDEVIYCCADISYRNVFLSMEKLRSLNPEIKLVPANADFVIGSNSIYRKGELYGPENMNISRAANQRAKRIFDVVSSLLLLLLFPLLIWLVKSKAGYFRNAFQVLKGAKTWVSYNTSVETKALPPLKKGVLKTTHTYKLSSRSEVMIRKLNHLYARNYKVFNDINYLINGFHQIGN